MVEAQIDLVFKFGHEGGIECWFLKIHSDPHVLKTSRGEVCHHFLLKGIGIFFELRPGHIEALSQLADIGGRLDRSLALRR